MTIDPNAIPLYTSTYVNLLRNVFLMKRGLIYIQTELKKKNWSNSHQTLNCL